MEELWGGLGRLIEVPKAEQFGNEEVGVGGNWGEILVNFEKIREEIDYNSVYGFYV